MGDRDDPSQLLKRAIRDARRAKTGESHDLSLRMAARLGWLAISVATDIFAKNLKVRPATWHTRRKAILAKAESVMKLPKKSLTKKFEMARRILNASFYENLHDRDEVVTNLEKSVGPVVEAAMDFKARQELSDPR